MAGYRPAYTIQDDVTILRYIIDNRQGGIIMGNALWKKMEEQEILEGRSWQSLKNRFRRTIAVDLHRPEYKLSKDDINYLLECFSSINGETRTWVVNNQAGSSTQRSTKVRTPKVGRTVDPSQEDNRFFSAYMGSDSDTE